MYTFVGPSEVISSKQKKTEIKLDIICYQKQTNTKQNKPIKNIKQKDKNPT